jgi:hypothetical protein
MRKPEGNPTRNARRAIELRARPDFSPRRAQRAQRKAKTIQKVLVPFSAPSALSAVDFRYLEMCFELNQVPVQVFLPMAIGGTERIVSELATKA